MLQHRSVILLAVFTVVAARAHAQEWPEIFTPFNVLSLHLDMDPQDWDTIRHDTTNEIEVPASLQATEIDLAAILVSVRRKSSRALPSEGNPQKVGLKVDINEYVDQEWHGLVKLSLENGADTDPIAEGLAWNLHEMASILGFYSDGYHAGLASWVKVFVNGQYLGVYVNVEQRDKQFLQNRGLFLKGRTWLYEIDDRTGFEFEVGGPQHSPTYETLCYSPFRRGRNLPCATPSDAMLAAQLPALIEMHSMLSLAAVDALTGNPDGLFSHEKNYSFADFTWPDIDPLKRRYYIWDLDAAMTHVDANIYAVRSGRRISQSQFESVILNHPDFRSQYNTIMLGLTDPESGPLSSTRIEAFLDQLEPNLTQPLDDDPYLLSTAGELFESARRFVLERIPKVRTQVAANNRPAPRPPY